jgi:N-methylhydantoinase A
VNIVNSGPAGGALAAAYVGRLTGDEQIISVDMGGTSFDVGVIDHGEPRVAPESQFEGFPVKIPILDVEAIGAGGGSLAWVDQGGALNVGPESAGSDPGPACYDLGGERPTVTDANLVLGRLNPDYFLGGEMKLSLERAEKAILKHVAEPLGVSLEEAASGIIRVVNANMERAISVNSTEKGFDVREFALLPFGGAGPLHAVELAEDLAMKKVVVPPYAGTFSAVGLLVANTRYDYASTVAKNEDEITAE